MVTRSSARARRRTRRSRSTTTVARTSSRWACCRAARTLARSAESVSGVADFMPDPRADTPRDDGRIRVAAPARILAGDARACTCPRRPRRLRRRRPDARLCVAGDAAAFDTLYARHKGGVYRYLLRHCGNAGTADELFQDVWMNVIRVRATLRAEREIRDVALPLAHNRVVDHWRATAARRARSTCDDDRRRSGRRVARRAHDEPEVARRRARTRRPARTPRWPRSRRRSATRSCCTRKAA